MKLCFLILFFWMPVFSFLQAQTHTIDSLQKIISIQKEDTNKINTLSLLSQNFRHEDNFDSSLHYATAALKLSQKLSLKKEEGFSWLSISEVYSRQYDFHEAARTAIEALNIFKEKIRMNII